MGTNFYARIIMFLKKKRNHNNNYYTAEISACVYNLPLDLVDKIRSQKKVKYSIFGDYKHSYTNEEYNLMMLGAMIAYQSQELLGTKIPSNDSRCIEIGKMLTRLGVRIQYHPKHGMVIVEDETAKKLNLN